MTLTQDNLNPTSSGTLDKSTESKRGQLTLSLPSERVVALVRTFPALCALVFEAWTKPEHVRRWWGQRNSTMTVCDIDLRVGGTWRYVSQEPDGVYGFNGVYREIVAPEKLVHTFIYEPMPEHEALVTVTFEEQNGYTTVTETTLFASAQARDEFLQGGMEGGANESFDRLEELLASRLG